MALKQRAEAYRSEAGALESRLALIKAQRNKLLAAFEGFAGTPRYSRLNLFLYFCNKVHSQQSRLGAPCCLILKHAAGSP